MNIHKLASSRTILVCQPMSRCRQFSSNTNGLSLASAREHALKLLSERDRSSYILHGYFPKNAQDAYLAIKLFDLDTMRIGNNMSNREIATLRFDFWRKGIQSVFKDAKEYHDNKKNSLGSLNVKKAGMITSAMVQEPIAVLLRSALTKENITLSKRFFITLLQSRETFSTLPPFRNLDSMASYGEGTFSQVLYLLQEACYSVSPQVNKFLIDYPHIDDLAHTMIAHIGQASGIAALLKGFNYYGYKGSISLPIDILAKHNLPQHDITKMFKQKMDNKDAIDFKSHEYQEFRQKLSEVVFETATRANDHIISASATLKELKTQLSNKVPDAIFVPALSVVPTKLFLEKLEKTDFDLLNPNLVQKGSDWKLPYRSFKAYKFRSFD